MWESDFPHVASYYPRSWQEVERVLGDVPAEDRRKLLYENAIRLYHIDAVVAATKTAPDELRRRGVSVLAVLPHGGAPADLAGADWWDLAGSGPGAIDVRSVAHASGSGVQMRK